MRRLMPVMVATLAAVACGDDDDETATITADDEAPACQDAAAIAPAIAEGLNNPGTVDGAQALEIEPVASEMPMIANMRYVVAGNVAGTTAVWAIGTLDPAQGGPILAVDDNAKALSPMGCCGGSWLTRRPRCCRDS